MKLRLSATEYMMIDIPQEVNKQEFYGLIKRMNKYQKFFTDGDVFSLKEEKQEGEVNETQKPTLKQSNRLYELTPMHPIISNREKSLNELKNYYSSHATQNTRKKRAFELGMDFRKYGMKIFYIKKKWKFTAKQVGVQTLNLRTW